MTYTLKQKKKRFRLMFKTKAEFNAYFKGMRKGYKEAVADVYKTLKWKK